MTRRKRRNHSSAFKAKVALEALKEDRTLAELAEQFDLHPNQIVNWRKQLLAKSSEAFANGVEEKHEQDLSTLHAKIGQQALEIDFLENALTKLGRLGAK